jgi:hypothetical protein
MTCPNCGSSDIRVSRNPHFADVFRHIRGQEAYRCRKCRGRFYGVKSAEIEKTSSGRSSLSRRWSLWHGDPRQRRRLLRGAILITVLAVAFAIFWFFLTFITTERTPPSGEGSNSLTIRSFVESS